MPKLPIVNAKTLIQFMHESGFVLKRQKGSHKFFTHPDGRTVPDHPGEDIGRGLLRKILNDIEISRDDFVKWLSR